MNHRSLDWFESDFKTVTVAERRGSSRVNTYIVALDHVAGNRRGIGLIAVDLDAITGHREVESLAIMFRKAGCDSTNYVVGRCDDMFPERIGRE